MMRIFLDPHPQLALWSFNLPISISGLTTYRSAASRWRLLLPQRPARCRPPFLPLRRAHGKDPFAPSTAGGAAPGRQELDRLRAYDRKVARAAEEAARRGSRAALSLDVAAASRFIDAAIPDLTQEQKQQLKRAAQVRGRGGGGWLYGMAV